MRTRGPQVREAGTASPSRRRRPRYIWLDVLPDDLHLRLRQGESVWKALREADVGLEGECGGMGKCGQCKVKVLSSAQPASEEERELLDEEELEQGIRLACRIRINEDLVIYVGGTDFDAEYYQILTTSHILATDHIPLLRHEPLMDKRLISLPPELQNGSVSGLDRIRLALGPEYRDLRARLRCLRTLPETLKSTRSHGAAVLHGHSLMAWQNGEEVHRHYGLVFDLGTSTLVGKLISLTDGSEVSVVSCLNSQSKYGTDLISRLHYVKEHANGLERLHNLLVKDLHRITARLLEAAGLHPEDIFVAVAAGNTSMQHFLLSLNPLGIAEAPFSPVLTDGLVVRAADISLPLHPEALLYVLPAKSGYIGGDLTGVILASGAAEQEDEVILGLDLGTNGEIFLGNGKRLMTCSAAAGPAFEGRRVSSGMIAKAGAIEGIRSEEDQLPYRVIGNIKPKGICGSGLVDLVAVLLHCGVIDHEGLLHPPAERTADGLNSRVVHRSGTYDFVIASAEESYQQRPIYLTQNDVRELQLAKAAIAAGIHTLMDEMGIGAGDIHRVYLAGALGNYVNPRSAMRIGLIPRLDPEVVSSLGNAASTGASMVLLSKRYWQTASELADFIEHIELSSRSDFNRYFIEHMNFPQDNMW